MALFDIHAAEVASRQRRRAKKLSFTFAEVGAVSYEEQYREQLLAGKKIEMLKPVNDRASKCIGILSNPVIGRLCSTTSANVASTKPGGREHSRTKTSRKPSHSASTLN